MPFKRSSDWEYSWEREKEKGNEFIKPITASNVHDHWTRTLGGYLTARKFQETSPSPNLG